MFRIRALALALPLLLLAACSSSGSGRGSTSGAMSVHLVDGPIGGYQELNVHIQSVEIAGPSGWISLGTPDKTYNLLALTGGLSATLADGATLAAGHYGQMRLILGSGNTVKLSDGTVADLTVPSGLQTGLKLIVSFDVAAGTTKDVWIDFDASHAIQVVQTGASAKYILRPTLRAFDKVATGSVSGVLTDADSGAPLGGATVYAETLDGSGAPALARSTTTNASGAYTLDLLPVGATYYVVSQPKVGAPTKAYDAKVSGAFALTTAMPAQTYSAAFTANASTGTVSGAITPAANATQSDQVDLRQTLAVPGGSASTFIVDSTVAVVASGSESYSLASVPAGAYTVQSFRTTLAADGSATVSSSTPQAATVVASATVTVNVGF